MTNLLAKALVVVFSLLSLVHVYWAFGGTFGKSSVIPRIGDAPAFRPRAASTLAVAGLLFLCALLIAGVSREIPAPASQLWLVRLMYLLAAVLLLRAIGDFQLVGFFKRERGSRFARLDTLFFSPLCLLLSAGVFAVGFSNVP